MALVVLTVLTYSRDPLVRDLFAHILFHRFMLQILSKTFQFEIFGPKISVNSGTFYARSKSYVKIDHLKNRILP